jgi:membrane protease YdiL (CAAX protease family)
VLVVLLAVSLVSARQHGLERIDFPGLGIRLSSYVTVIAEEWLLLAFVWLGLRRREMSLSDLISGRWTTWSALPRDLGLALIFILIWSFSLIAISSFLKLAPAESTREILPRNGIEAAVYVLLSGTAGFCEEVIFRGYLQRQFTAWTGSTAAGVLSKDSHLVCPTAIKVLLIY